MRLRSAVSILALAAAFGLGLPMTAQAVPTGFVVDTLVSTGLTAPNDFCFLPDGRILIANRTGPVMIYAAGSTAVVGTVANVELSSEQALLSVCADPAFATNGYIYVWYCSTLDAFVHLDRFTCTGDLGNPASTNVTFAVSSRRVVLTNTPDNAFNHNGGTLRFGPDGKLYLTMGEDASPCQSQALSAMQGKLLRMNVSGLAAGGSTVAPTAAQLDPGDNPLSANADFSKLVIAYGLRNPFRMTIDPLTNNVYIGDVGQNAMEEYDEYVYQAGALQLVNFGWPWREGTLTYTGCGGTPPAGQHQRRLVAGSRGPGPADRGQLGHRFRGVDQPAGRARRRALHGRTAEYLCDRRRLPEAPATARPGQLRDHRLRQWPGRSVRRAVRATAGRAVAGSVGQPAARGAGQLRRQRSGHAVHHQSGHRRRQRHRPDFGDRDQPR